MASIPPSNAPVKGSNVSVTETLIGGERVLGVRVNPVTSVAETIAVPLSVLQQGIGPGITYLASATDVSISYPVPDQYVLAYSSVKSLWVPTSLSYNQDTLKRLNNLSDLENTSAGRVNLGLGALAVLNVVTTAVLVNTSVSAGTYGNAAMIPQITVDAQGRITEVVRVTNPGLANDLQSITGNTGIYSSNQPQGTVSLTGTPGLINVTASTGGVNIALVSTGVTAGTYGNNGRIPIIGFDEFGRIVEIATTAVSVSIPNCIQGFFTDSGVAAATSPGDGLNLFGDGIGISTEAATVNSIIINHLPSGVSASTYGTSSRVPRFTVNAMGHITSVTMVTIEGAVQGNTFTSVVGNAGTVNAGSPTSGLGILGAGGILTSVTGSNLTIYHASSGAVAGSYGSATAIPTFSVNGQGIVTSISQVSIGFPNGFAAVNASVGGVTAGAASALNLYGDSTYINTSAGTSTVRIQHNLSGVGGGTYGTSLIIPRFTVDAAGHITTVVPVTIERQNAFTSIKDSGGTSYNAPSATGGFTLTGANGILTQYTSVGEMSVYLQATGASAGSYGTSLIIPQFTVNQYGQVTNIGRVTIEPQNAFVSITGNQGSYVAGSRSAALNIVGAAGVLTSVTNSVMSIYLDVTGVAAGTYGTSLITPQFTVNARGQITTVVNVTAQYIPFAANSVLVNNTTGVSVPVALSLNTSNLLGRGAGNIIAVSCGPNVTINAGGNLTLEPTVSVASLIVGTGSFIVGNPSTFVPTPVSGRCYVIDLQPNITFIETDVSTDEKAWAQSYSGSQYRHQTFSDAGAAGTLFYQVIRNGTSITSQTFSGGLFQFNNGGMVVGNPTGGNKGAGSGNFGTLWANGAAITCYVLEAVFEGSVDLPYWNSIAPEGYHFGANKFAARLGTEYDPLDLDKYWKHAVDKKHLTSLPNREHLTLGESVEAGSLLQRLWETVEIQAVHIEKLNQRLKLLEGETS